MSVSAALLLISAASALAAAARAPVSAGTAKTQNRDNSAQAAAIKTVQLPRDEDYFVADEERAEALQASLAQVLDTATATGVGSAPTTLPPVLAIGAPKVLALEQRDDIPLLLARRVTGLRAWQVGDARNLRVVATDLRTGQVRTARLATTREREEPEPASGRGAPPDAVNATAVNVALRRQLGLRRRLGLPWQATRLALTVVAYDWISNTVVVELRGKGEGKRPVPPPSGAAATVEVEARPPSARSGLSLTVPPKAVLGASVPLGGAIRMRKAEAALKPATGTKSAGVVLAASLLLVKLDAEAPIQVDFNVPARTMADVGPTPVVEAAFALQVRLPPETSPGSYQAYLVTGAHVAGPYPLELTAP